MSAPLLFDSLSHPTLTGDWFGRGVDATVGTLVGDLAAAGFGRACAVGMAGHEAYDHQAFAVLCRPYEQLVPIAGVVPRTGAAMDEDLDAVVELGFAGIKIHPRLSRCGYGSPEMAETLRGAWRRNLPVFLCTYGHTPIEHYPDRDPLYDLVSVLKQVPGVRLVLLHGGAVDLMRWMAFCRHNETMLLDLSFTIMRYAGSSIDLDIGWLFDGFNRRTCIGTDHPVWSHADLRDRFDRLSTGKDPDAVSRIGGVNLARFLELEV